MPRDRSVWLSWKPVEGATSYVVRFHPTIITSAPEAEWETTETSFTTPQSLTNARGYVVTVNGKNAAGEARLGYEDGVWTSPRLATQVWRNPDHKDICDLEYANGVAYWATLETSSAGDVTLDLYHWERGMTEPSLVATGLNAHNRDITGWRGGVLWFELMATDSVSHETTHDLVYFDGQTTQRPVQGIRRLAGGHFVTPDRVLWSTDPEPDVYASHSKDHFLLAEGYRHVELDRGDKGVYPMHHARRDRGFLLGATTTDSDFKQHQNMYRLDETGYYALTDNGPCVVNCDRYLDVEMGDNGTICFERGSALYCGASIAAATRVVENVESYVVGDGDVIWSIAPTVVHLDVASGISTTLAEKMDHGTLFNEWRGVGGWPYQVTYFAGNAVWSETRPSVNDNRPTLMMWQRGGGVLPIGYSPDEWAQDTDSILVRVEGRLWLLDTKADAGQPGAGSPTHGLGAGGAGGAGAGGAGAGGAAAGGAGGHAGASGGSGGGGGATCNAIATSSAIATPDSYMPSTVIGDGGYTFAYSDENGSSICVAREAFCATGTTGTADPDGQTWGAAIAFNLKQAKGQNTTADPYSVPSDSTGVSYAVNSLPSQGLRLVTDDRGTPYCAVVLSSSGKVPWTSFSTTCWSSTGSYLEGPPTTSDMLAFDVPAVSTGRGSFDFCVTSVAFY